MCSVHEPAAALSAVLPRRAPGCPAEAPGPGRLPPRQSGARYFLPGLLPRQCTIAIGVHPPLGLVQV